MLNSQHNFIWSSGVIKFFFELHEWKLHFYSSCKFLTHVKLNLSTRLHKLDRSAPLTTATVESTQRAYTSSEAAQFFKFILKIENVKK